MSWPFIGRGAFRTPVARPRRPAPGPVNAGLGLLGCVYASFSLVLLAFAAFLPNPRRDPWISAECLGLALLGCLSAITAEALCLGRPWAYRAALALACATAAMVLTVSLASWDELVITGGVLGLIAGAAVAVPTLGYIRKYASPVAPAPVPRPRPLRP